MNRRFGCFGLLFPLILLLFAYDNISNSARDSARAARYPQPVTLTIEEFARRRPTEGWFRITGGVLDLASASATKMSLIGNADTFGAAISVEAPLRSRKEPGEKPPSVLVVSSQRDLCEAWQHLQDVQRGVAADAPKGDGSDAATPKGEDARGEARVVRYAIKHPEKVFVPREVEGILFEGAGPAQRRYDATVPTVLAENYVRLEVGKTNADYKIRKATNGVIALIVAVLYIGWQCRRLFLSRAAANNNAP